MASDNNLQVYCQPCDDEGIRLPAHCFCIVCKEHLCRTCFMVHKKLRISKHHTLLDATSMPKVLQQPTISITTGKPDDLTTPCMKHPKEMTKFYCHYHTELLCSVCVTLKHQASSCNVNYIPDISGDIIDSKEYKVILKALSTTSDKYQKMITDIKKMVEKSNCSLRDAILDIKKFRQDINQRLDELEKQAEDQAKVIEHENNKYLKAIVTTCEDITKVLTTSSDKIKQLNTFKQADALYMELKLAEKTIKDVQVRILQLPSHDIKEHTFHSNMAILNLLNTEGSFGTLTCQSLHEGSQSVVMKSRQSSHQGEICVKTSNDKARCWITGMTLPTPDHLIITDYNNRAVKMVYTRSQSVSDQLQVDDSPWDITTVTRTELAVTLPQKQTVQFISISSNKLIKKHIMKMTGECCSISCYQDKLVVSFCRPAKLQILHMTGSIQTTIDVKNMYLNPWYVKCNSCFIYDSGWGKNKVKTLNWHGDVMGTYKYMINPRGISLSNDGTIFVCDWERGVIEEISGDCSTGKVLLKDLIRPGAVCWCRETKMLCYSCDSEDDKYSNFIHIYKLS